MKTRAHELVCALFSQSTMFLLFSRRRTPYSFGIHYRLALHSVVSLTQIRCFNLPHLLSLSLSFAFDPFQYQTNSLPAVICPTNLFELFQFQLTYLSQYGVIRINFFNKLLNHLQCKVLSTVLSRIKVQMRVFFLNVQLSYP